MEGEIKNHSSMRDIAGPNEKKTHCTVHAIIISNSVCGPTETLFPAQFFSPEPTAPGVQSYSADSNAAEQLLHQIHDSVVRVTAFRTGAAAAQKKLKSRLDDVS